MKCDKCNQEVAMRDDETVIEGIMIGNPFVCFVNQSRHIACSPSRAQYIVHPDFPAVIDDRPQYDKRRKNEDAVNDMEFDWTNAWVAAQQMFPNDDD